MELKNKDFRTIRILVVLIIILFGAAAALDLFNHPVEVMILAVPFISFLLVILTWQSIKWILITGIITIAILLVELLINIFYYNAL